jgi:hypothetical protein
MSFPRFNSGSIGRLTFDTMNQVFDRIEALESDALRRTAKPEKTRQIFPVRVTGTNAFGQSSFYEVHQASAFTAGGWNQLQGGVSSSSNGNDFAYPLRGLYTVNQIVWVSAVNADDGTLYYVGIVDTANRPETVIIKSSGSIGGGRWLYTVWRVFFNPSTALYQDIAIDIPAYNGAENRVDGSALKGVGFMGTSTATYTRNPIANDVVVTGFMDSDGTFHFSMPNGYTVTC